MKKILVSIILFVFMLLPNMVNAYTAVESECTDNDKCLLLCNYHISVRDKSDYPKSRNLSIYYNFDGTWSIKWENWSNDKIVVKREDNTLASILKKNNINDKTNMEQKNFKCPKYAYIDTSDFYGGNEICFDNDGNECKDAENFSTVFVSDSSKYNFESSEKDYDFTKHIDNYFNNVSTVDIECSELINGNYNSSNDIIDKIKKDFKNSFLKGYYTQEIPIFIQNTEAYKNGAINIANNAMSNLYNKCVTNNSSASEEEIIKYKQVLGNISEDIEEKGDEFLNQGMNSNNSNDLEEFDSCISLLGEPNEPKTPAWYLSLIFSITRYAAIILLIVMTILDFVGAVASQDNDILKKAVNKTITRAVICIFIFILPTILDFVLQFIHNSSVSDCIR